MIELKVTPRRKATVWDIKNVVSSTMFLIPDTPKKDSFVAANFEGRLGGYYWFVTTNQNIKVPFLSLENIYLL